MKTKHLNDFLNQNPFRDLTLLLWSFLNSPLNVEIHILKAKSVKNNQMIAEQWMPYWNDHYWSDYGLCTVISYETLLRQKIMHSMKKDPANIDKTQTVNQITNQINNGITSGIMNSDLVFEVYQKPFSEIKEEIMKEAKLHLGLNIETSQAFQKWHNAFLTFCEKTELNENLADSSLEKNNSKVRI